MLSRQIFMKISELFEILLDRAKLAPVFNNDVNYSGFQIGVCNKYTLKQPFFEFP
jgi:hypothetical protein